MFLKRKECKGPYDWVRSKQAKSAWQVGERTKKVVGKGIKRRWGNSVTAKAFFWDS